MTLARATIGAAPDADAAGPGRHEWLVLAVALSASFMAIFDLFVVNIAMPDVRAALHAGDAQVELVVSGYAFAYAAGLITGGRLGDRFGYRRMFVSGMAAFTAASGCCALAQTDDELVIGRILQGLTAAGMVPQVLSLITVTFPAAHRGRASAWYGVTAGLAALVGQIGGGLLLHWNPADLGWRAIFLVNVPVGCAVMACAMRTLPTTRGGSARLDPLGASAVTAVMALVLVPLALGRDSGWPAWVWICLAAAALTGPAVLAWQREIGRRGGTPIIDTGLFRNHAYTLLLGACSLFQLYFGSFMFTLSLLLQVGLGEGAEQASVVFVCQGLLYMATSLQGGRLVARHGRRVPLIGAGVAVAGLGLFAAVLTSGDPGMPALIAVLGVIGAGNGLVSPPLLGAALSQVRADQAGAASGALNTAQQFCNSLGVTLLGTVFFAVAGSDVSDTAGGVQAVSAIYAGLLVVLVALAWAGWPRPAISPARLHDGRA